MARTGQTRSQAVYGLLLGLYAPEFLARHRAEMLQDFEDLENASSSRAALWLLVGKDLLLSIISRNIPKSIWGHAAPAFIVLAAMLSVLRAFDLAPASGPEALGFSSSRLARIEAWQQAQVDAGAFSGAVAAIARNGKVAYLRAVGFRDRAKTVPLQPDAIFWIASMTKPVTSVAANGGELDGVRVLSPATVRRMTTNSLPPGIRIANGGGFVGSQGGANWGLGFAIRADAARSKVPGSVGSFTWNGLWGSNFWVDPAESLIAIQLIQTGTLNYDPFWTAFRNLTYGALLVPDRGVPASSVAPAAIDQTALAAFAGTFRFTSTSSRDKQAPPEFGALGIEVATQDGLLKVVSPIPGMPAFKAGILAGDIITHVDDGTTEGLSLDQSLGKLRGPVDTNVRLRIDRKGQDRPIEVSLVRAQFRVPGADLQVVNKAGHLLVEASGDLPLLDFEKGEATTVVPMSGNEFFVDSGDHTRLAFLRDGTGLMRLVLNPGPWQITGQRIN